MRMNKMSIPIYTTDKDPEDITPFAWVVAFIWKAYDAGELNVEKVMALLLLHRHVNPYEGIGRTSYAKICTWLKLQPTKQNINHINKVMTDLRDKHELVFFPEHSGSRDFKYVIAGFKFGKKQEDEPSKWIDIKRYFPKQEQSQSRGTNGGSSPTPPEQKPKQLSPQQRFERSNSGGITSVGEDIKNRYGRPPYTNTES